MRECERKEKGEWSDKVKNTHTEADLLGSSASRKTISPYKLILYLIFMTIIIIPPYFFGIQASNFVLAQLMKLTWQSNAIYCDA